MSDAHASSDARRTGERPSAIVIGAGIVGATVAWALGKSGVATTLVDADGPGAGCSYGNAGAISESSVAPVAMPGVSRNVLGMLLDPEGPLRIRPARLPRALPWLLAFMASARPARVERIAARLHALHHGAVDAHLALAREIGAPELVVRHGHLHLYPDEAALAKDADSWALRQRYGVEVRKLNRAGIVSLEPAVSPRYQVGMFLPDHAMVVNPQRYVDRIVAAFRERGGRWSRDRILKIAPAGGSWVCASATDEWHADHVVVAAGIASKRLLAPLGIHPPLESQRGYHAMFEGARAPTSRIVVLADRKAFTTPMETGFRIAGTVEIGGTSAPPDPRRSAVLERIARETFPALAGAKVTTWMGHRPCMPDSLPWVGPARGRAGLHFAFGHGHLGVTDAPGTARRIVAAIAGSG